MDTKVRKPVILFRIGAIPLYVLMMGLPLVAVIGSVILATVYHYKSAVWTSCKVWNFLPSISAAVSAGAPQDTIWPLLLGVDTLPRLMSAVYMYNHLLSYHVTRNRMLYAPLVAVCAGLHVVENLCLVTLSFFSSSEYYDVHETSYILFLVTSFVHMMLTVCLFAWSRNVTQWTSRDVTSFRTKVSLFVFYVLCVAMSAYLFFRHNRYCEPGMYSLFASFEYLTVFVNIGFHGSALFEYSRGELVFINRPLKELKQS